MSEARKAVPVGHAHDQGRDPTGPHHQVGVVGVHHGQGEGTPYPGQGGAHRPGEPVVGIGGQVRLDQVGQDLGVGLRLQVVAVGDQLVGELDVVLDDAVVDQGQAPGAVGVGMGVLLVGAPVGGPAGVADAGRRPSRGLVGALDQVVEGAGAVGRPGPPHPFGGCRPDQGQPGRVVAPVLQTGQALDEHVEHRPVTVRPGSPGDADDAAHGGPRYPDGTPTGRAPVAVPGRSDPGVLPERRPPRRRGPRRRPAARAR